MDKSDCGRLISKNPMFLRPSSSNDHSLCNVSHPIVTKIKNNEKNNESNIIDYKKISLTMTGEISSACIDRNNLTQRQPNTSFIEDENRTEDDEHFISNMKEIIDKNYKMKNKENYSLRDLQSKSYLSRKKKCAFTDEDQNLMKRFKKSVDKSKASYVISQEMQQSENVTSVSNHNHNYLTTTANTAVTLNNSDVNFRKTANQFLFHVTSKMQKNDRLITPENTKTVAETEIEQLIYYEMNFTPPQRENDDSTTYSPS